jgi:cellobiose-specific phosphotransferase system component IIC
MKEIVGRLKEPTPQFWKNIQKFGLALGIIGGAFVASPVATLVSIGGYLITGGTIIAGLSQLASTER